MPFKKKKQPIPAPSSPVALLPLLTRRKIPDAFSHQKDILNEYKEGYVNETDVAMQLPTGSGKTLVGLLIAEWRRRSLNERVVYLCPTKQLVHQVARQAEGEYGIDVVAFTGPKNDFPVADKSSYMTREKIAVTTYSALFNSSPFFTDPGTILFDDAHAAENYVVSMWSLKISATDEDYKSLHAALSGLFKNYITPQSYRRLIGDWEDRADSTWIDKLPTEIVATLESNIVDVIDSYASVTNHIKFTWPLLRDHLRACHIYLSPHEILIRPLLPPTWSHTPFNNANHRLYMSATLGAGGDLERLIGRKKIVRIDAPDNFKKVGVGRRFFIFPGLSFEEVECEVLRKKLQKIAGRSVVLTPHTAAANAVIEQFDDESDYKVFTVTDIETSKSEFIKRDKAVAVMAGRFDGVDFPHEDCRLLCLDGLSKAANAQERFFMIKMGASALLKERMQTRILQAAGRCTRALQDRSAVYVTGRELLGYFVNEDNWIHLHPEFQAELAFGVYQSKDVNDESIIDTFKAFITNDKAWEDANRDIVDDIDKYSQEPFPEMDELENAVPHEIDYQRAIWHGNYEQALAKAREVVSELNAPSLGGYRALWHYLAGSAARKLSVTLGDSYDRVAREQYAEAHQTAPYLSWLIQLAKNERVLDQNKPKHSIDVVSQVERLEEVLLAMGTETDKKFEKTAKSILDDLEDPDQFEKAQCQLGRLLGFVAENGKGDAAPDSWWLNKTTGIVFENHVKAQPTSTFGANKAKQAAGHPAWLQEYNKDAEGLDMTTVIITPCTKAGKGAKPPLKDVHYWSVDEFKGWAREVVRVIRELKASLPQEGDIYWRQEATEKLVNASLTLDAIRSQCLPALEAMEILEE